MRRRRGGRRKKRKRTRKKHIQIKRKLQRVIKKKMK